ncbi:hypothetical protein NE237_002338 [Protea cynaroides]|uniref:Oxidoreductase FAD/NAD(P)-binding domain-containing protein n=1 Tax=Protea cynaroides TaxID=273540 RepID=A0A9Q0QZ93_9MAGN|nr:hypothetical protein NE237_002338 [Protea cynaroides]
MKAAFLPEPVLAMATTSETSLPWTISYFTLKTMTRQLKILLLKQWINPFSNRKITLKKGGSFKESICSNFLCDSKPGDKVQITGPSGKIMLLPEDDTNATHIMVATGTGVASFGGYLCHMFMESLPTFKFGGLAWLFLGLANSDSLLYDDEFTKYL